MGCPAEEKGLCVKCVIEWFISLAGTSVLSVGSKLQRGERGLKSLMMVKLWYFFLVHVNSEVVVMPGFCSRHLGFPSVSVSNVDVAAEPWPVATVQGSLSESVWLKFSVFNMDTKGPSGTFKRSSLKRSASGSQKVRWILSRSVTFNRWLSITLPSWLQPGVFSFVFKDVFYHMISIFLNYTYNGSNFESKFDVNAIYLRCFLCHSETSWLFWEWLVLHSCCHMEPLLRPESILGPNQSFYSLCVQCNDMHHSGLLVSTWSALPAPANFQLSRVWSWAAARSSTAV